MEKRFEVRCRGVILDRGELLVVEHAGKEGFLALPGGHLEWGEDVKSALSRELVEELGVLPIIGPLLYVHTFTQESGIQPMEFFFRIENATAYRTLNEDRTHAHELATINWVQPTETRIMRPIAVWSDFKSGRLGDGELRYLREGVPII
ncbi:MAG: NUDIX hydrolase [Candidatus Pacebacteria bacterium]|jgi:ADP-ribose pyrophosphatase YjhB (NUDIX family)|nr:NUDIX hydrolase [Candidatus Paceibacterota bacterium]